MRVRTLGLVSAGAIALASMNASAAVLAAYTFGTTAAATTSATTVAANATAAAIGFGAQTTTSGTSTSTPSTSTSFSPQNGNNYSSPPWLAVAQTNNGSASDYSKYYVEYSVTAASGYALNLTSATFDAAQGGGTAGQRSYAIYDSVDGLALSNVASVSSGANVGTGTFTTVRGSATAAAVMPTYSSTSLAAAKYQGLSSVTIRVYFATPTTTQNIDVDNFVLNGSVVPATAVPEPASLGAIAAASAAAIGRRRRR